MRFLRISLAFFFIIFINSVVLAETPILPLGYRNIQLGMSFDDVKIALLQDPDFGYRGERDVSLLPGTNRKLIETNGSLFLAKCWFQFYEDKLYIFTLNMNENTMDYYSVFKTLCEKYGNPQSLSPELCSWTDDSVIMTLEKPLCIKYTDNQVYRMLEEKVGVEETAMEDIRKEFLDSL